MEQNNPTNGELAIMLTGVKTSVDEVKDIILKHLDTFQSKESWYLTHGIPYHTGILLYGPPGTGKTSIIKAISNYLNYQIHILNSGNLGDIESAMFSLPEKSLIVIEDIDGLNPGLMLVGDCQTMLCIVDCIIQGFGILIVNYVLAGLVEVFECIIHKHLTFLDLAPTSDRSCSGNLAHCRVHHIITCVRSGYG